MAKDQECPNWASAQSRLQPKSGNINIKDTAFVAELMPCNQGNCIIFYPSGGNQIKSKKVLKLLKLCNLKYFLRKKILCIQPHPDDNEIGMGGIISYLTSKGVQVDYLTVTDGSLGDIGIIEGDLMEIR